MADLRRLQLLALTIIVCSGCFPPVHALSSNARSKFTRGSWATSSESSRHAGGGTALANWQGVSSKDLWSGQGKGQQQAKQASNAEVLQAIATLNAHLGKLSSTIDKLATRDDLAKLKSELSEEVDKERRMGFLPRTEEDDRNKLPKEGNWTVAAIYFFMAVIGCVILYCIKPSNAGESHAAAQQRVWNNLARSWNNNGRSSRQPVEASAPSPPVPAKEFIQRQDVAATAKHLSGRWRGYYEQYGSSQRLCEFTLVFERGQVNGEGVDDVGAYSITGLSSEDCLRIAFSKQYVRHSLASNGDVNQEENLGHVVEYRGMAAGPEVATSGVRGTWFIQTSQYTGQGNFHIWPVEGLHSEVAMKASEDFRQKYPTFEVSAENICVVCFDRTIDVLLDPCGHIVVCQFCAQTLNPHRCPICRSEIQQILSAKGAAMNKADASEQH